SRLCRQEIWGVAVVASLSLTRRPPARQPFSGSFQFPWSTQFIRRDQEFCVYLRGPPLFHCANGGPPSSTPQSGQEDQILEEPRGSTYPALADDRRAWDENRKPQGH